MKPHEQLQIELDADRRADAKARADALRESAADLEREAQVLKARAALLERTWGLPPFINPVVELRGAAVERAKEIIDRRTPEPCNFADNNDCERYGGPHACMCPPAAP